MAAVTAKQEWELVHKVAPTQAVIDAGAYQREDGMWVYRKVAAPCGSLFISTRIVTVARQRAFNRDRSGHHFSATAEITAPLGAFRTSTDTPCT